MEETTNTSRSLQTPPYQHNSTAVAPNNFLPVARPDKSKMTLDFNSGKRLSGENNNPCFLDSPDMQMLKVNSPELEKMIMANYTLPAESSTPTPTSEQKTSTSNSGSLSQTSLLPSAVSSSDLSLSRSEIQVLPISVSIIPSKMEFTLTTLSSASPIPAITVSQKPSTVQSSGAASAAITVNPTTHAIPLVTSSLPAVIRLEPSSSCFSPVTVKDEPILTSSDESSSFLDFPEDMQSLAGGGYPMLHDQIRQERKRLRNRIAATKCRRRKLEKISTLEDQVKDLKRNNSDLNQRKYHLKEQVALLKTKVMTHLKNGCQVHVGSNMPTLN